MFLRVATSAVVTAVLALGLSANAMAETQWQKNHPRRTQVNGRLANQNKRIANQEAAGKLSAGQAATPEEIGRTVVCTGRTTRFARKNATWPRKMAATSPSRSSAR